MPTPTIQRLSYALCASIFLFGSGYACPPPNYIDPEDTGKKNEDKDDDKNEEVLGKFVDRISDCIDDDKGEGDCDGYPGREDIGREKGNIFKNFKTLDCEGDDFEFASLFKLDKKGVPKYKSIVFAAGAEW